MTDNKKNLILMAIFSVASLAYLFFISWSTSPIYNVRESDSAVFQLIGKMTHNGLIPYVDFFDHKGPVIVLIMWLTCGVTGKSVSILLFQWVCFILDMLACLFIGKLFLKDSKKIILSMIMIFLMCGVYIEGMLEGGNIAEEYNLPFLLWSQYFSLKYLLNADNNTEHNPKYSIIYGITFMVCAFTRLTNALTMCSAVFVILIILIKNKKIKNIIDNAIYFVAGLIIVTIPILIWSLKLGNVKEMFYCTFVYNLKYAAGNNSVIIISELIKIIIIFISPIIFSTVAAIYNYKNKKTVSILVIFQAILAMIFYFKTALYIHYLLAFIPLIYTAIVLLLKYAKKYNRLLLIAMTVIILSGNLVVVLDCFQAKNILAVSYADKAKECQYIKERIYKKDVKVIVHNAGCDFYYISDIMPCYRNFNLQHLQTEYDTKMRNAYIKDLSSNKADYIIETSVKIYSDKKVDKIIESNYKLDFKTKNYAIYKRK